MEKIYINGGKPLFGTIEVGGMKNSALPILFATILIGDKCVIENLPIIDDVVLTLEILRSMGADVRMLDRNTVAIDTSSVVCGTAPDDLACNMRGSYYIAGAELGRFGRTHVALPGGCDLGPRPIDQHVKGFKMLGANITDDKMSITADTDGGILRGTDIYMDVVSVGATMNIMLAAVLAEGTTVIDHAAKEPHIVDLANFLNSCGADITGAGTDVIRVKGVSALEGVTYAILPDMIEAGTYMIAAAATGGKLNITNVVPKHLESISAKLEEMGVTVEEGDSSVTVTAAKKLTRVNVKTQPYPGFPTDMNPQMCVLLCIAEGISELREGVWENRFKYVRELLRMGASIMVDQKKAVIEGVSKLHGASVIATDLRAGAAMVIAGLAAEGCTEIGDIYHIERGYENIVDKLREVGADIEKRVAADVSAG